MPINGPTEARKLRDGHWLEYGPVMREEFRKTDVVPEAYELVEHELITPDDYRDFMFTNAVRFRGEVNPHFFKGTAVEQAATETLARPAGVAAGR
jgi:hypothetical protein